MKKPTRLVKVTLPIDDLKALAKRHLEEGGETVSNAELIRLAISAKTATFAK